MKGILNNSQKKNKMKTKHQMLKCLTLLFVLVIGTIRVMAQGPYPNEGAQTVCITGNAEPYGVIYNPGSTYSWKVDGVTTSADWDLTATNTNLATILWKTAGIYHVQVFETTIDNCAKPLPVEVVVTVNPTPDVVATPSAQAICNGGTTGIALTSNLGTTSYVWTASLTSGTASGFADGSGSSIAQTLTNTTNAIATVTYTITPLADGCPGSPITVVITVYPQVTVTATPSAQAICNGGTTGIALTGNTGAAGFIWTAALTSGTAGGFADGSGASIEQTLTNTTNALATVTYTITPSDNSCPGTVSTVVITVYPQVTVTATPIAEKFCTGGTTDIALTSNTGAASFTWTATLTSGTVTGFADGSGALISQTLVNATNVSATVTYTITPSDNSCPGTVSTVVVTIDPMPTTSPIYHN